MEHQKAKCKKGKLSLAMTSQTFVFDKARAFFEDLPTWAAQIN